jgi:hypothetical protein
MGNPAREIKFDPKPLKVGDEWHIVASWPDGREEHISGFKNEIEAINWIGSSKHLQWLKARGFK